MDQGQHDPCRAVGHRVPASIANGLGGLEGKEDGGHGVMDPGEASRPVVVLILVVRLHRIEDHAGDDKVNDEDRRPHQDEAEPAHLKDLVHAFRAAGVTHDADDG